MSIKGEKVKITQLQNPSQFFFFFHDNPKWNLVKTREKDLQKVLPAQIPDDGFSPKVGDVCCPSHNNQQSLIHFLIDLRVLPATLEEVGAG